MIIHHILLGAVRPGYPAQTFASLDDTRRPTLTREQPGDNQAVTHGRAAMAAVPAATWPLVSRSAARHLAKLDLDLASPPPRALSLPCCAQRRTVCSGLPSSRAASTINKEAIPDGIASFRLLLNTGSQKKG
jgi:hypothetical protein